MNKLKKFISTNYSGLAKSRVLEITADVINEQILKLNKDILQYDISDQLSKKLNLTKNKLYSIIKQGLLEIQKDNPDSSKIEFAKIHITLLLEIIENENLSKLENSNTSIQEIIINEILIPNYLIEWTFNNHFVPNSELDNLLSKDVVEINGIKWATKNIGSNAPSEFGNYYTFDNSYNAIPKGWRLPTELEFQSLISSNSIWTNLNGVNGRLFGVVPNQIFIPAAGFHRFESQFREIGKNGKYWSSTESDTSGPDYIKVFDFNNESTNTTSANKSHGRTIRCVID